MATELFKYAVAMQVKEVTNERLLLLLEEYKKVVKEQTEALDGNMTIVRIIEAEVKERKLER